MSEMSDRLTDVIKPDVINECRTSLLITVPV
jgi:hypothetical protein